MSLFRPAPQPNSPETALPWPEARVVSSPKPPQRGFCASKGALAGGNSCEHPLRKPLTCGFARRRRELSPCAARARTHNPRFWPRRPAFAEATAQPNSQPAFLSARARFRRSYSPAELTARVSGHAYPLASKLAFPPKWAQKTVATPNLWARLYYEHPFATITPANVGGALRVLAGGEEGSHDGSDAAASCGGCSRAGASGPGPRSPITRG